MLKYLGVRFGRLRFFATWLFCALWTADVAAQAIEHAHNAQDLATAQGAVLPAQAVSTLEAFAQPATTAASSPEQARVVLWRLGGLGLSEGIRRNLEASCSRTCGTCRTKPSLRLR